LISKGHYTKKSLSLFVGSGHSSRPILQASRSLFLLLSISFIQFGFSASSFIESPSFDDSALKQEIENPEWFKLSFLELNADIEEARENKKSGVIFYFGQKRCPYCKKFLEDNFSKKDILKYVKAKFDVVGINVRGTKIVTDFKGKSLPERQFAAEQKANFTPSLLFYNVRGKKVLKLVGYQSPYRFRAAMEYVHDRHYEKESFRDFLGRAKKGLIDKHVGLNSQSFFSSAPYQLDRRQIKKAKPLMIFFEQANCHACDVLHAGPLLNSKTKKNLNFFETVQLDMWSDTKVITPSGEKMTAKQWAEKLGISYTPTLVLFDQQGKEIIRAASIVDFFRINKIINYVLQDGYKKFGNYRAWHLSKDSKRR